VHALAEAVLASGHKLVATTADPAPLKELAETYGDQLRILPIEVNDPSAARAAVEATLGAFGRIDIVVLDVAKFRRWGSLRALQQKPTFLQKR
jgi:NAD(P)-dependent dehydrogenase (short-subunit alcohol dehydrogenase family)